MKLKIFLFSLFILSGLKGQTIPGKSFTSFDGTKINYQVKGEGKPVVLIHGFIVNSGSWEKSALPATLIKSGHKVVTLDLRGNGFSDKPKNLNAYVHDAEIKDVIALMKFLQLKNYDVVGYSRGAILTARMLVIDKNIHRAVLGGMGEGFTSADWPRRKMFEELFSGKAHLHPELKGAIDYAKSIAADTIVLGYLQHVQPVTSPAQIKNIKNKVLIIAGDQDKDNGDASALAKLFPHSILKVVPGNHNNTSQSPAFADEIAKFLK